MTERGGRAGRTARGVPARAASVSSARGGGRARRRCGRRGGDRARGRRVILGSRGVLPVLRDAPGGDHHAGAGSTALRLVRPHEGGDAGRAHPAAQGLERGRRAADAGTRRDASAARSTDRRCCRPDDTGEAQGLPANGLTITIGLGPSLFDDRFGLASLRPADLEQLPLFAFDLLDPELSDGDLCIQACANDPQVAVHAIRNLTRIAFGTARIRWSQLGFGRTSSTSSSQATPPQPVRVQGRHGEHQVRATEGRRTSSSGSATTSDRAGCAAAATSSPAAS